ncbi:MAG: tetratricopeptide repeat protein [Bauldia sp.]|jgi:tetratricopeptide (TPR) repeat protein
MRLAIAVLAACLAAAIPAGAQVAGPLGAAPAGTPAEQIDYWFDRLAATTDTAEGVAIGERIRALWLVSGGPTAALLIRRASDAAEAGEPTVALDLLDGLLALQPALAEVWHQRAIVHFELGDYTAVIADVRQTLILEPRHFVALSGLAQTFYQSGDKVRALEAIRASLAINPFQPGTQDLEARLEAELNRRI